MVLLEPYRNMIGQEQVVVVVVVVLQKEEEEEVAHMPLLVESDQVKYQHQNIFLVLNFDILPIVLIKILNRFPMLRDRM